MRKLVATILAAGLVVGMIGGPAFAGKKKKISDTFTAGPHVPGADVAANTCLHSEEGVSKTSVPFKTPGKGVLEVSLFDFQGDWDLYVVDSAGNQVASSGGSQLTGDPAQEQLTVPLAAKKTYNIVACNFGGGPLASGEYTYTYKK